MDMEISDYSGTGANHDHDPPTPSPGIVWSIYNVHRHVEIIKFKYVILRIFV